ncbi:hypothetical protein FM104_09165 [Microbacterium esteraromaticum]|uniref:Uncharacterized protein n=1 Tax=Microbacterium esteraromaticum TaxID=57043 RepID=A0A1R4JW48_9MICO|nr:hypothetical protein [Microbacterium esteraromaticum]SJN36287.1 hypothetical protein FM104_09165 [Microbacterium esteraromaticum]
MTDPRSLPEKRRDPTRMANQPALTTSSGTIWIVMGAVFVLISAYPLSALLVFERGAAFPAAVVTAIVTVVLYVLVVIMRFTVPQGRRRLQLMAGFFIAMVALTIVGLLICAAMQGMTITGAEGTG